ncbi:MAG TPA: hypothetical protein VME45_23160 [Stellaceae bacterium]|nr:hypothetical protein [Stellaceae bacterium]
MPSDEPEIRVCRQHRQIVPQTKLRQKGVDSADLNAMAAAFISEVGGIDVVGSIGGDQGHR